MSEFLFDNYKNILEASQSGYLKFNNGVFPLYEWSSITESENTYLSINEFCLTNRLTFTGTYLNESMAVRFDDVYTENPSAMFIVFPILGKSNVESNDFYLTNGISGFPDGMENFACPVFTMIRTLNLSSQHGLGFSMCNQVIYISGSYKVISARTYRLLIWRIS